MPVPKKSPEEVKKELKNLLEEVAKFKEEGKTRGAQVDCLTEEQILAKITGKSGNSPFLC